MQSLLKIIVAPDISYQYEPNFIRWYFQPLLRYSPIKFACVALKTRYPSVIWCQEKIPPEKSPRKGSGVGLGLESGGLFSWNPVIYCSKTVGNSCLLELRNTENFISQGFCLLTYWPWPINLILTLTEERH